MIRSEPLTGSHQPESRGFILKRINQVLLLRPAYHSDGAR
jgi:hypothetical protein